VTNQPTEAGSLFKLTAGFFFSFTLQFGSFSFATGFIGLRSLSCRTEA
jgi:hypothetical protein